MGGRSMELQEEAKTQVQADEKLVTEFFWAFNWLEAKRARKHGSGWGNGVFQTSGEAESLVVSWPNFSLYLESCLGDSVSCEQFTILCEDPPMRRSLDNGQWQSGKRRKLSFKNSFSQVPVLRNNLFHGSKSVGHAERNNELLRAGVAVINVIYKHRAEVFEDSH